MTEWEALLSVSPSRVRKDTQGVTDTHSSRGITHIDQVRVENIGTRWDSPSLHRRLSRSWRQRWLFSNAHHKINVLPTTVILPGLQVVVLLNRGQRVPEQRALPLLTSWRPRPGSRGRRKTHSGPLLGHQHRKLCAKLLIVRVQPTLPERVHKANIVLTQTLHQKKKFYSITMARLSPFSVMLYCCVRVLPGPKKSYLLPNRVKKKSQHNITCLVSWL